MQTGVKVEECMRRRLHLIDENASVFEAAAKMKQETVDFLLVNSKGQQRPFGIVTKSDIVFKSIASNSIQLMSKIKLIASKPLISIPANADIEQAIKVMAKRNVKRLVVKEGTKLIGSIEMKDIMRVSPTLYELVASSVESSRLF